MAWSCLTLSSRGLNLWAEQPMVDTAYQILQTRLIDSQAVIRDADEGCLGIIVELTIKVYPSCQVQIRSSCAVGFAPMVHQVLAGVITYESSDTSTTIKRYNDACRTHKEGLPSSLSLFQCIRNTPAGKMFSVLFVWASTDINSGNTWPSKASSWSDITVGTVATTDMVAFN
ncbi:FAD-binding domain-containing protein [Penicillium canescens]|uniref:FAD-binding domain-containing protein n=1 Tax=Penicillium canescens TaxID=5083 RepID=UPI0026DF929C|nr:FAD-binding domain-containing protein [Penicillium canescens]KAJ6059313.1 FAD-binding domain-containing protein [Penicillium canescens]